MLHIIEYQDCWGRQGVKSEESLGEKEQLRNGEVTKISCFKGVSHKELRRKQCQVARLPQPPREINSLC